MNGDSAERPGRSPGRALDRGLLALLLLGGAWLIGSVAWQRTTASSAAGRPALPVPTQPIALDGAPQFGSDRARVAVVEYSDFQCPSCGEFARSTLASLKEHYAAGGRVRFVFRNLPLASIHPHAWRAASGAHCASESQRFWPFHDFLFARQQDMSDALIAQAATHAGLSPKDFSACVEQRSTAEAIEHQVRDAHALGILGTPTFVLGTVAADGAVHATHVMAGARPFSDFIDPLDRLVAGEYGAEARGPRPVRPR